MSKEEVGDVVKQELGMHKESDNDDDGPEDDNEA